jgi:hypothetical protein
VDTDYKRGEGVDTVQAGWADTTMAGILEEAATQEAALRPEQAIYD